MKGSPVGDQSRGVEPGSREVVPSTVTLRHNPAAPAAALWLQLSCSRYSKALSSSSLLFICVTLVLLAQAWQKKKKKQHIVITSVTSSPLLCWISREYIHMFPIHEARGGIGNYSLLSCFCRRLFVLPEFLILIHCNCLGQRAGSWL